MDTGTISRLSSSSRTIESKNDMFRNVAISGNREMFERMLYDQEVDVYEKDSIGKTILMLVSENGHVGCLKCLVEANKIENINQRQEGDERTALMLAAMYGHTECVRSLFETGQADVNLCDSDQWTALMMAAKEGHIQCVRYLIDTGLADLNPCDWLGDTAFMLVAKNGHAECLKYLVGANKIENIDQCNKTQETALMLAARNGYTECVRFLIDTGDADVYHCDSQGFTALILVVMADHLECLKYLVDANKIENINHRANNQQTALMYATSYQHIECIKCLVETGQADVNLCDSKGQTALMYAAEWGDYECVRYFIDTGLANVNVRDYGGSTPLMQSAQGGYHECVRYLIDTGRANVNIRDNRGFTALMHSVNRGRYECVRCLTMTEGIAINLKNKYGRTALMAAVERDSLECMMVYDRQVAGHDLVRLLMRNEMLDPNIRDQEGRSALMLASMGNCIRSLELLLNHDKVDVNMRDNEGRTALMLAILEQRFDCFERLISNKKVNVDGCDNEGMTAFMLSVRLSNDFCLRCFLEITVTEEMDVIDNDRDCDQRKDKFSSVISPPYTDGSVRYFPGITWRRPYIYERDQEQKSVLKLVIRNGLLRCIVCFLLAGIDVPLSENGSCSHTMLDKRELSDFDKNGQTSLILALQKNHFESVEYTIQYERIRIHILVILLQREFFAAGTISLLVYKMLCTLIRNLKEIDQFILMLCNDAEVEVCVDYLLSAFICQIESSNQSALLWAIDLQDPNYMKILLEHISEKNQVETAFKELPNGILNFHHLLELLKLDIFLWKWYPQCLRSNIKALTRELIIRDFAPGCFEWQDKRSSPIHFAFMSGNEGLVRYIVSNLYVTSRDLEHVQINTEIRQCIQQRGSEGLQQLYQELFSAPWRLEIQCLLTLSNWLRNNKHLFGVDKVQSLLPEIFRSRLPFTNPMRMICQRQWRLIDLHFMNGRQSTSLCDWNLYEGKCCNGNGGCLKFAVSDDDYLDYSDSD